MLEFVLRWAPYGGPRDEDTLPEFGMTRDKLRERFRAIVGDRAPTASQAGPDQALIKRAAKLLDTELRVARAALAAAGGVAVPDGPRSPRGGGWRMDRGVWRRA